MGASYIFGRAGCRRPKAEANALLAVKCCFESNRRAEITNWRDCRVVAAQPKKWDAPKTRIGGPFSLILNTAFARQKFRGVFEQLFERPAYIEIPAVRQLDTPGWE